MLSPAVEDYLKTIFLLQDGETVSKTKIARALGVSPASVTNMVKRLAGLKMVQHESYKGVSLTEVGEKVALEIIRHHRLLESYLKDHLGYSWEQMHAEAERLEHHISEEFEEKIDKLLGYPTRDPHGHHIPSADLVMGHTDTVKLAAVPEGSSVRIDSLSDKDVTLLDYLEGVGLMPGAVVTIDEKAPLKGPMTLTVSGKQVVVGYHAASHVFVVQEA